MMLLCWPLFQLNWILKRISSLSNYCSQLIKTVRCGSWSFSASLRGNDKVLRTCFFYGCALKMSLKKARVLAVFWNTKRCYSCVSFGAKMMHIVLLLNIQFLSSDTPNIQVTVFLVLEALKLPISVLDCSTSNSWINSDYNFSFFFFGGG